ncbi:hypothetical protein [Streptomyces sp. NPDC015125]|uniref:hypothetical protein n=1 Tax=Streptomyces sp. NPDC015125 TaxID=3364938 RepID=UPI0037018FF2
MFLPSVINHRQPFSPAAGPTGVSSRKPGLFIAPGCDEHPVELPVHLDRNLAVTYGPHEMPEDRDPDNVLLQRWGGTCTGDLDWGAHQTHRQVYAMDQLRCCGCAEDPDIQDPHVTATGFTPPGMLWLLPVGPDLTNAVWPKDVETANPPICLRCAHRAVRACDALQRGFIALRVRTSEIIGYYGTVYTSTDPPQALEARVVKLTEPAIDRTVARQLVRRLHQAQPDPSSLALSA